MQLELGEEVSISNSAYTQSRAKLNYTAFQEYVEPEFKSKVQLNL